MDPDDMRRPSPPPERSVLGRGLVTQILATGALIAAVAVVAGLTCPDADAVQTWVFLSLGLAQLGVALALRAPRSGPAWRSRGLEGAVVLAGLFQVAAVVWSPLQRLLGTVAISPVHAAALLALSAIPGVALALRRR